MKNIILFVGGLFLVACGSPPEKSIVNDAPATNWIVAPLDPELNFGDSIGIFDTNIVHVNIAHDIERLMEVIENDSLPLSKNDYVRAFGLMVNAPSIKIDSSIATNVRSAPIIEEWVYDPVSRLFTREVLKSGNIISKGDYILDSTYFSVTPSELRTTTFSHSGDTLEHHQFKYILKKNCIGKKHGEWSYFDSTGQVFAQEVWLNGIIQKQTNPNKK